VRTVREIENEYNRVKDSIMNHQYKGGFVFESGDDSLCFSVGGRTPYKTVEEWEAYFASFESHTSSEVWAYLPNTVCDPQKLTTLVDYEWPGIPGDADEITTRPVGPRYFPYINMGEGPGYGDSTKLLTDEEMEDLWIE